MDDERLEELENMLTDFYDETWKTFVVENTVDYREDFGRLYHYTDIHGLKGILETGEIWATNADYLNDTEEIKHGERLAAPLLVQPDVIDKTDRLVASVLAKIALINRGVFKSKIIANDYIACFCTESDQLSQWRGYGSNRGYAIELEASSLDFLHRNRYIDLVKVVYKTEDQEEVIQRVILECRNHLDKLLRLFPYNPYDDATDECEPLIQKAVDVMSEMAETVLHSQFCRMKDHGFHEEHEWRILYNAHRKSPDVSYRVSNGILVPFIKLPLFRDKDGKPGLFKVTGITCGPAPNPEVSVNSIKMFLETLRLKPNSQLGDDIEIRTSKIPFRCW